MSVAVVGHTELVEFVAVEHLPAAGEIVHATDAYEEAAGGGAVAAFELARLEGSCSLYTALGDDEPGARAAASLARRPGVEVLAGPGAGPQRRALTMVQTGGERTIVVLGERLGPRGSDALPWRRLAACAGVYFTAGDAEALRAARAASVLVATTRAMEVLAAAGVALDAIVLSDEDAGERYEDGMIEPRPGLVFRTRGAAGGRWEAADGSAGEWAVARPPGPVIDTYGAGDCFAAGLTHGLAHGLGPAAAAQAGARSGAAALTRRGPYGEPAQPSA